MKTINLYIFLFLILHSPCFVYCRKKQNNALVQAFVPIDAEPAQKNQLVLNVNGNIQTIPNNLFEYVEDNSTKFENRQVADNSTIKDLSESSTMQVHPSDFRAPNTNKRIAQFKNVTYKNGVSIRNNRFKKKCTRKEIYGINQTICLSHRKIRHYDISTLFIEFTSLNIKNSTSREKILSHSISNVRETKSSRYIVGNKGDLKKRLCRYHFKFYFKYFPVLQSYMTALLESMEEMFILSLILDVGFIMSCLALICIFLSMIISRKLREEKGNIILLHFCFSIFVQIILHVVICIFDMSILFAEVASNTFQYFTLVEFAWTSVIAFIQYRRYVKVFSSEHSSSVWKLCLIVYISSAVPIIVRVIWDHDHSKFMTYLTFSVPQFITLVINFIILILISRNIMCTKVWFPHHKRRMSTEAKVIFMLFLILDLGWIVAMLALLTSNIIFAYIFIFSQSLQGFVMFFIFIIMHRSNRTILKNIWISQTIQNTGISSCKKGVETENTYPIV